LVPHGSASHRRLSHLRRVGGRSRNYDFDGVFVDDQGEFEEFKIELKRGSSIYDQPQFAQYYAKAGELIASGVIPYAEFFYDNYLLSVTDMVGLERPLRDEYLENCFRTDEEVMLHTARLKALDLPGSATQAALQRIAFRSIDAYLEFLESDPMSIDVAMLQRRLNEQNDKVFISWDAATKTFSSEIFSPGAMTIVGHPTMKCRPSGERSAVVVRNAAGHAIEALLRWKNRNCCLGPAWQVSLREP
jgi:hypothetical protein